MDYSPTFCQSFFIWRGNNKNIRTKGLGGKFHALLLPSSVYFYTAMHLSLLSVGMFSLEHQASEIMVNSNLFLNNIRQQPCSLCSLEKTELSEQNIKIDSFLIYVFHFIMSLVSTFWALLGTVVRLMGRKLACLPWLMKGGQF